MRSILRASHLQRASAAVAISVAGFFSAACSSELGNPGDQPGVGGGGNAANGGGGGTANSGSGGTAAGGTGGTTGGSSTGGAGTGGTAGTGPIDMGSTRLRLLTQSEYLASLKSLFGNVTTQLDLPDDLSSGGFIA